MKGKRADLNDMLRAGRLPPDLSLEGEPMNDAVVRIGPWAHLPLEPHPDLAEAEGSAPRPPFPVAALPGPVADFVEAVSVFMQTPPDLAGVLALGVLSASVAGKARVAVKGSYSEPLNLFLVVAMDAGERKSPVFRVMLRPLARYEERLRKETKARRAAVKQERKALEDETASLRKRLTRAKGEDRLEIDRDLAELADRLEALPSSEDPVLYLQDVTPERLVKVLEEQNGRVCIADDEGGFLSNILGRYGEEPVLEGVLKAHAGSAIKVDRVGRPTLHVERPAVTLALTVQPDVIRRAAATPGFRERGALGRMLMSLPKSLVGFRDVDAPEVPKPLWSAYGAAVERLLGLVVPSEVWLVPLSEGARAAHRAFDLENERMMAPGRELSGMRDWGGKAPGAVARLAGVLHFALGASGGDEALRRTWTEPVSEATMLCAVELGGYFVDHARAVYGELLSPPQERRERDRHASALATLAWLYREGREFLTAEPLEALWPNTKVPPPPAGLHARDVVSAFCGKRTGERPGKDDLAYALRGAVGKPSGGLVLERRGNAHNSQRRWAVVPAIASSPSSPSSPRADVGGASLRHPGASSPASSPHLVAERGYGMRLGEHGDDGDHPAGVRTVTHADERGGAP